jgi:parallel beta-helix repeat protein
MLFCIGSLLTCYSGFTQTPKDTVVGSEYNIMRFGAKGDGKTNNTTAIQKAVDECHVNGGGKIIIPAGNFVTGTIHLYSNMNLDLEPGSVLSGSLEDKDYLYQKDFGFTGPGAGVRTGILVAHNAQNISLSGSGAINGNSSYFMYMDSLQQGTDFNSKYTRQGVEYMNSKYGQKDGPVLWKGNYDHRPGVMVIFSGCKNIRLSNIKMMESPNWTVAFLNSTDIQVRGISIENNMLIPNSDGIDLYDSKNITISDCEIQSGDDAIAVVSSSFLRASHCSLHSRSCGIRVGYNVFNNNNSGNLLFDSIRIYDSNRGIGIFQRRQGNMDSMVFSNINIGTRLHTGQWWGHGEPIHISAVPGLGSRETGSISNLRFSNITAVSESGIVIYASAKGLIRDIYLDNISLTINRSPLEDGYGGNIDLRPVNNIALGIFRHNIPAVYSAFADGLVIRRMNIYWGDGLPAYFNHAVECTNFGTVTIDGLHEHFAKDSRAESASTVCLHKGGNAHVKDISSSDKKMILILRNDSD